ncbi:MAG: CRTAC1 family protein [Planctomycetales bacterium]|nr:CRTAC1 family protein [Planctomycetales bacterium]
MRLGLFRRLPWMVIAATLVGCGGEQQPAPSAGAAGNAADTTSQDVPAEAPAEVASSVELPTDGTRRMTSRLKELIAVANPDRTPSIAPIGRLADFRARLAKEQRPDQRVVLRSFVGWHALLVGETEQALAEFDQVYADLSQLKLPPQHSFFKNLRELNGIANLRYAEQQNCLANHTIDSCIMPMRGGGIHQLRDGALEARDEFLKLLELDPEAARPRWLLNLTNMVLGDYPDGVPERWRIPPEAFESAFDIGRFLDVAAGAKVDMLGLSGGVIADDFNGDLLIDLVATDWGIDQQMRLFINQGDGTFADRTDAAGLVGEFGGLNVVQADYDNDGRRDMYVLRGAWLQDYGQYPNSLLRNLGGAQFDDVTYEAGVHDESPCQSAVWFDFDLDGDLDLFVGNETFKSKSYPCRLYRNLGDGKFEDIAVQVGLAVARRVKGVACGDVNNDGWPDLYLSCFGEENVLFKNEAGANGERHFTDVTAAAGVGKPIGSFPTWMFDFDNDGWLDIFVAPFSGFFFDGNALPIVLADYLDRETNADRIHLFRNMQDGTFRDVAPEMKLDKPLLAMGANFGDLDNDGFLDCYIGTGDPHFGTLVPNRMFRNDAGRQFQDVTTSGGFGHVQKGHGIAFADFDNDGDQDIYAVLGGAITGDVYQNALFENPGHGNHWITLWLRGTQSNRDAIGARIRIRVISPTAGKREIHLKVDSGGSFGASSLQQEVGLGDATEVEEIEVIWPNRQRTRQVFKEVALDQSYELVEGVDDLRTIERPAVKLKGVSADGHHHHH